MQLCAACRAGRQGNRAKKDGSTALLLATLRGGRASARTNAMVTLRTRPSEATLAPLSVPAA
jgi:hypothetical protein